MRLAWSTSSGHQLGTKYSVLFICLTVFRKISPFTRTHGRKKKKKKEDLDAAFMEKNVS